MQFRYIYLIVLAIIMGGCISNINSDIGNISEKSEKGNRELKINSTNGHSKEIIFSALNQTDKNVIRYISSISTVRNLDEYCSNDNATGCAIGNFTVDGNIKDVRIYLLDYDLYKGLCNNFEQTLFHEIGHTVYFYKYGNRDVNKTDILYQESLELYADKYANKYSKIQKATCNEDYVRKLKYKIDEKEKIYEYSLKILSKWGKYKDIGIPIDMSEEYQYDYDAYLIAKKDFENVMDDYKDSGVHIE